MNFNAPPRSTSNSDAKATLKTGLAQLRTSLSGLIPKRLSFFVKRKASEQKTQAADGLADRPTHDDGLGYGRMATQIATKIIALPMQETPLTIGIYGAWGSGKTSFLSMIAQDLENAGIKPVWFNAWRYDKEENLWSALLQTILTNATVTGSLARRLRVRFRIWWSTLRFARGFFANRKILGAILRILLFLGLIGLVTIWNNALQKAVAVLSPNIVLPESFLTIVLGVAAFFAAKPDQLLKLMDTKLGFDLDSFRQDFNYKQNLAFLDKFHEEFELIVKLVSPERPLVVIIDDLDRCLPEKAIAVLEAIKHFVDVPGCVFLVAIDNNIIEQAIRSKYKDLAPSADQPDQQSLATLTSSYIEKIVHLPLRLPQVAKERSETFIAQLLKACGLEACGPVFAAGLAFNPRKIKRVLRVFIFINMLATNGDDRRLRPSLLAKLILLQHEFPTIYEDVIARPPLLHAMEQHCRGTELVEPLTGILEVAQAYCQKYPLLREMLTVAVDKDDTFISAEIKDYIYFLTAIVKSSPEQANVEAAPQTTSFVPEASYYRDFLVGAARQFSTLAETFIEPYFSVESRASKLANQTVTLGELAQAEPRVLIIGEPGSGKTSALRWLAAHLGGRQLENSSSEDLFHTIPVFISLRATAEKRPLIHIVTDALGEARTKPVTQDETMSLLRSSRLLLLLDGIDEVLPDTRLQFSDELQRLIQSYPGLRCIATTRHLYDTEIFPKFSCCRLQPFNEEQIRRFFEKSGLPDTNAFNEFNRNAFVTSLRGTPLLLQMILVIFRNSSNEPHSIGDLYDQLIETITRREMAKYGMPQTPRILRSVFSKFAYRIFQDQRHIFTTSELRSFAETVIGDLNIEDLEITVETILSSPILVGADANRMQFAHKSLQEYFVAIELSQSGKPEQWLSKSKEPEWQDILLFIADIHPQQAFVLAEDILRQTDADAQSLIFAARLLLRARIEDQNTITAASMKLQQIYDQTLSSNDESASKEIAELIDSLNMQASKRTKRSIASRK